MIGEEIRQRVFRDTTTVYEKAPPSRPSYEVMKFVKQHSGHEILDYGCATGMYCIELSKLGYSVQGVDINERYVERARQSGVDAHVLGERAPFPDKSVDTVLLLEVLEHLEHPEHVLHDAIRLARTNVLVTTPNSSGIESLQALGLLFEHFADMDHRNFFTPESLQQLLSGFSKRLTIRKGNAISPFNLFRSRSLVLMGKALTKIGILRAGYHMRLYAVIEV